MREIKIFGLVLITAISFKALYLSQITDVRYWIIWTPLWYLLYSAFRHLLSPNK